MPLETVTDKYVAHGLQLIRLANGLNASVADRLNKLNAALRALLSGADPLSASGRRNIAQILSAADEMIAAAYATILAEQTAATAEIIGLEATWAQRTGKYAKPISDAALTRAKQNLLIMGNTSQGQWQAQLNQLRYQVATEVRLGVVARQSNTEIARRVAGTGPGGKGGVVESAKVRASGLVDASTHTAADAGRREAMRANGINAIKWHAVLDTRTCPSCGERAGKLWDMDGKPVGHGIPYYPPALHPWCRCITTPMKFPKGPPEDGGKEKYKFEDFLKKLNEDEQQSILGKGRAQLWRDKKITTADLIGQNGLVMDLKDLRLIVAEAG